MPNKYIPDIIYIYIDASVSPEPNDEISADYTKDINYLLEMALNSIVNINRKDETFYNKNFRSKFS